jgi:hypothetical protein
LTHEATVEPAAPAEQAPPAPTEAAPRVPLRVRLLEVLAVLVGYSALTVVFFPALRDRSQAFYQELLVNALSPDREGVGYYLKHGDFPTWTRDTFGGSPYSAQIQHALYYPGNLPFAIFHHPSTAIDVVLASSVVWCAFGMWAYCRFALKTSFLAAALGGLAFGFGGMALQHVTLTNQLQALSWMPFTLLFAHLALETKRWRHTVLTAVCVGMGLLAGHPEEWVYTCGALSLYAVFWAFGGGLRALGRRSLEAALRIGGAFVLFVAMFGFQLLPTLKLMGQGYRNGPDFRDQYPLPTSYAVNSLLPDFGRVLAGENVAFVGVLALGLAALGLVASRRAPLWLRLWVAGISAFGFAMAVGNVNPVYRVLYDHVSIVRSFRVPSRYLLLPSFALAAIAAVGMDALLLDDRESLRARARQGALAVGALVAMGLFAFTVGDLQTKGLGPSYGPWLTVVSVGVAAWALRSLRKVPVLPVALLLLVTAGVELEHARPFGEYHQVAPNVLYNDPGPVVRDLAAAGGRYLTIGGGPTGPQRAQIDTEGLTGRKGNYFLAAWPLRLVARPSSNLALRAQTVLGRDGGLLPLGPYRDFFLNAASQGNIVGGQFPVPPSKWNWNGLDLLAIQSFVTQGLPDSEAAVLRSHGFTLAKTETYVQIWRRTTPPLARVFYDVDVLPTREARVAALPTYPLLQRAMVNAPVAGLGRPTAPATVTNTHIGNTRVVLDVTSTAPGLLVLADPFYPGWKATVNGRAQTVLHADHAFRGVVVPAGHATVVFTYHDSQRQLGLVLLPLSLLGIAGAYLVRRRRSA